MPALRKRKDDIPLLVSHFIQKYCQKMGRKMKRLAPEVIGVFEGYHWPGNVRELENIIERIVAIEERETITKSALPQELLSPHAPMETDYLIQPGFDLNKTLDEITKKYVQQALLASGRNLKETASLLGINYRSLRYLVEKFGLKDEKEETAEARR
jgi:DNA-binding NtrC family response regulator